MKIVKFTNFEKDIVQCFDCNSDILKVDFFARTKVNFLKSCARKCKKNTQKDT